MLKLLKTLATCSCWSGKACSLRRSESVWSRSPAYRRKWLWASKEFASFRPSFVQSCKVYCFNWQFLSSLELADRCLDPTYFLKKLETLFSYRPQKEQACLNLKPLWWSGAELATFGCQEHLDGLWTRWCKRLVMAAILSYSSTIPSFLQTHQDNNSISERFVWLSPGEYRHHRNCWPRPRTKHLEIRKFLRSGSGGRTRCSSRRNAWCASQSPRRLSTSASLWRTELFLDSLEHHWRRQAYRLSHQIWMRSRNKC